MSLHNGIDTVAIATVGIFTKTYGSANPGNIANLFVSWGLFEDAPGAAVARQFFRIIKDRLMANIKLGAWT